MPIEFNCESCSRLLRVPDGSGGKQCHCPGCSTLLNIPLGHVGLPESGTSKSAGSDIALCIPCPRCKHELICDPGLVGTKGQCRSCKHIFVISELPTDESQAAKSSIAWVFSCPKCDQLFEGSDTMRGRRGKCHACGAVFPIELRVADKTQETPPSNIQNSFDSFEGELTLAELTNIPQASRDTTSNPRATSAKQATASSHAATVSKVPRTELPPIQFNCTSCKGRMEVPGVAAQQLTHCPHCKRQQSVPAENEPLIDALAAADPWADLGPLGGAIQPVQQADPFGEASYPPAMPGSSMTSYSRKRSGGSAGQFVVCGIFVSLCAFIAITIEIAQIVLWSMVVAGVSNMNDPRMLQAIITIAVAFVMLVLSTIQLIGGIALARRRGLGLARTAVVLCCLPCLCVFNIPFGIWGCVLAFNSDSTRNFR